MKTVILAGGVGSRLAEETAVRPKAMVEIGGKPIIWHIMKIYASQGFNEFVMALGYKGEVIKNYFLNLYALDNDISVDLATGRIKVHERNQPDWKVHLVDTGLRTQTGGRIRRLASWIGQETFMLAYGDGVADINLRCLLRFHRSHGKLATVTAVRPPARFGGLTFNGDRIVRFAEKAATGDGWVNAGFFVLEPSVLDYIEGDNTIWEREPLERLAADGQLVGYRHTGFWQPMDTLRDKQVLEVLWESGKAPWRVW